MTKDGHINGADVITDFSIDVAEESVDDADEELIILQSIEAADRPRFGFHQTAELLLHDHLEVEFVESQRRRYAKRSSRTRNHFARIGFRQIFAVYQDGSVKFVA